MLTQAKRIGSAALVALVALGFAVREAPGQGFTVKPGQPVGTGGVSGARPNSGVGFNYSAYGAPVATMTSSPYSSIGSTAPSNYGGGSGYGGYGNYILPDPYSGFLNGSANVINAQGTYLINSQQSYLLKEQVRGAMLENRRKMFDEWLYERANTPTLNDERERIQREELRRSRNDPPLTEIWSAKALNDLLNDAQKFQAKKIQGPNVPIDEDVLKQINLTSGRDGSNFGLLKDGANLSFPLALRGLEPAGRSRQLRDDLQTLVKKAYDDTKAGKTVSVENFREIDAASKDLHDMLVKNVGQVSFSQYSEAKAFLKQLDDASKALKGGDAAKYINGDLTPKGASVAEVIEWMSKRGLQFAPATGNSQAAYVALHRALAAYDVAGNTLAAERDR